jgi:futalosine hydrolase
MPPLVLVPTELERGHIAPLLTAACGLANHPELCGFGPIVAAARTARLIADLRPDRVLLVGIAGRYADRLEIGRAYTFERVACHGVGAGSGVGFVPAEWLGWRQWPPAAAAATPAIGDVLPCTSGPPVEPDGAARADLLLSACAAAADADDVRSRLRLHPEAVAEDMEGFAVAAACRLAGVPLDIVRGISNTAGDRDPSGWRIEAACRAAAGLAATLLGGRA